MEILLGGTSARENTGVATGPSWSDKVGFSVEGGGGYAGLVRRGASGQQFTRQSLIKNQVKKGATVKMDCLFSRTSVTTDEAVGILIGWLRGPFDGDLFVKDTQTKTVSSTFNLAETLNDEEELLESRHAEACYDKLSAAVIAKALEALTKHRLRCDKARKYLCEIEDELNKEEQSALRLDKKCANYLKKRITLSSLNEWSTGKYGIDILSPNRLSTDVQEAQAGARAQALLTSGTEATVTAIEIQDQQPEQPKQPKQRAQEKAILAAIESLGHDPKCIPKIINNKRGVKADVKAYLTGTSLFPDKSTIFQKAWERLRGFGDIVDEK